ncbi:MAG: hypothetical protein LBG99_04385, partial [Propionibacteriaceae bacterium]|nr:hypothetical protein [Propionibacteriaceae bacterium]
DFELGTHTATLTGKESGQVSATFQVIPTPVKAPTGGTALPQAQFPIGLMMLGSLMAISGVWVLPRVGRNKRERVFS